MACRPKREDVLLRGEGLVIELRHPLTTTWIVLMNHVVGSGIIMASVRPRCCVRLLRTRLFHIRFIFISGCLVSSSSPQQSLKVSSQGGDSRFERQDHCKIPRKSFLPRQASVCPCFLPRFF